MDILKMMGKARELQSRMSALQDELKALEATGQSGAGAVTAKVNGQLNLVGLTIDPALLKPEEKEIVEDLVVAAVADAKGKIDGLIQEKSQAMMGEMGLPAGFKLPFGG
jgi:DNA-binding YbaB/EbfC family protein